MPTTLKDIRDVPIPNDPVQGEAFHYEVNGSIATLSAPAYGDHLSAVRASSNP